MLRSILQAQLETPDQLRAQASNAARTGEWAEAVRRWERFRARSPDDPAGYLEGANALRNAGVQDQAELLLSDATRRFPSSAPIAMAHAYSASQRRDWPEALRRWETVRTEFPDEPSGYVGAATALRETDRLDEAEALLSTAVSRFPTHAPIAIAHASLAVQRRDWPEALRRWETVRTRFPDEPQGYLGTINALRETGRSGEANAVLASADAVLRRARGAGRDDGALDHLELAIARTREDWPAIRRSAERIIAAQAAPTPQILTELAGACWHLKDLDAAEQAAARALASDPSLTYPALIVGWVATAKGDGETALAHFRHLAQIAPDNPRWPFETARLLNFMGQAREAERLLEEARRRWPADPLLETWMLNHGRQAPGSEAGPSFVERELRELLDLAPRDEMLRRPPAVDDPSQDVIMAEAKGATTAVIVFTGPHDHVTMPIQIFDRYLASFGVTSIYLKDFDRLMYLRGVRSLGDLDGTLSALQGMWDRLGIARLCTIGVANGAAIAYGVRLGADRILSFSTTTGGPPSNLVLSQPIRKIIRMRADPENKRDLRKFLEDRQYSSKIELVYAEGMAIDRAQAERLSGLPGVTLHPQAGINVHAVLRSMAKRKDFRDTLGSMLGIPAARADK